MSLRYRLYQLLEQPQSSVWAKRLHTLLALIIVLNVIAVLLETDAAWGKDYGDYFVLIESVSVGIFTLEYLARLWVCVEATPLQNQHLEHLKRRWQFMLSPMAVVDLIAISPFYLAFLGVDLLMLRSIRLMRILKLGRYSRALNLLMTLIRQERDTLLSALLVLMVLVLMAATGMYLLEGTLQPEAFGSIPRALWWAVVTLTTIGYGDAVPLTVWGKLFGGVIVIGGVAIASLPAAILSSGLINELNRRRESFRHHVYAAYSAGHLNTTALAQLEQERQQIGLSQTDAQGILKEIQLEMHLATLHECPHCHNSLWIHHHSGKAQIHQHDKHSVP